MEDLICKHVLDGRADESNNNTHFSPAFIETVKSITENEGANGKGVKDEIYNYCLLNHYRSGEDSMGYHADDEMSMDANTPIASVSLGVTRNFDIRPRKAKSGEGNSRARVARIALGDGDLLLMLPPMQSHYEHAIPVEKRVMGERINYKFDFPTHR